MAAPRSEGYVRAFQSIKLFFVHDPLRLCVEGIATLQSFIQSCRLFQLAQILWIILVLEFFGRQTADTLLGSTQVLSEACSHPAVGRT